MESLQVPVDGLARLCHLASLGKLLGGLIHNLNSPLHSMGMQMDVIQHFILQKDDPGTVLSEKISARLAQMNEEFENLSNQIRIAGMRADLQECHPEKFNLNHFLHQELQFLKTNLHFKHNVETTTEFSASLRAIAPSSPYFSLALSLLLERVADNNGIFSLSSCHCSVLALFQHRPELATRTSGRGTRKRRKQEIISGYE
ncbi:MAG: hypothetical protein P8Y00_12430 [Deltaproteobacteria bacterium]